MHTRKRLAALLLSLSLVSGLGVAVLAAEAPAFSDVSPNVWYARAVEFVSGRGLMNGVGQNKFEPNEPVSRGMVAVILYRLAGSPASGGDPFFDVPRSAWYADAAAWAGWNGVISGYGNDTFGGEDPVTREQLVTILWRHMGCPPPRQVPAFDDEWLIASYAAEAVDWAQTAKVVTGKDDNLFDPKGATTRAELAVILQRFIALTDPTALATPTPAPTPTPEETPEVSPDPVETPPETAGPSPEGAEISPQETETPSPETAP